MIKRSMVLALAVAGTPWIAHGQPIQGVYVGAGAGGRLPFATKNTALASGFGGAFDLEQNLGYDGRLSVGYALGNGWRFELEGSVARSYARNVSSAPFPSKSTGTVRNRGIMANAVFDLDIGSPYVFPYLGLGAGYQSTKLDSFVVTRTDQPFRYSASGEAGAFAAQAILGLAFPVPNLPGLSITADYRLMDVLGGEKFSGTSVMGPAPGVPVSGATKFHNQFSQSAIIGVRFAFDTPMPAVAAAPAAPAAAPPQPHSYLVPFESNQSTLDARARATVKGAALASAKTPETQIALAGQPGGSGGAALALNQRRADAVTAALVSDGVPREAITVRAQGAVAVPGPDGANSRYRRVEIVVP